MYCNIYTFTQRETHLLCQTNRKTFLLTAGMHWENKVCFLLAEDLTSPPMQWEKGFFLSQSWREEVTMTPAQRDDTCEDEGRADDGGFMGDVRAPAEQTACKIRRKTLFIENFKQSSSSFCPGNSPEAMNVLVKCEWALFRGPWSERCKLKVGSYTDRQKHRQVGLNEQLAKSKSGSLSNWMAWWKCNLVTKKQVKMASKEGKVGG